VPRARPALAPALRSRRLIGAAAALDLAYGGAIGERDRNWNYASQGRETLSTYTVQIVNGYRGGAKNRSAP
jgi:hypothetical protein